jgi:hypothetical protein
MLAFRARRGSVVSRCTLLAYYAVSCQVAHASNTEHDPVNVPVPSSSVSESSSGAAKDIEDIEEPEETVCNAEQLAQVQTLLGDFVESIQGYDLKAICDFSRSVPGLQLRRPLGAWARECLLTGSLCIDKLLLALTPCIAKAWSTDSLLIEHGFAKQDDDYDVSFVQLFCRKLDRDLRRWSGALKRCKRLRDVAPRVFAHKVVKLQADGKVSGFCSTFLQAVVDSSQLWSLLRIDAAHDLHEGSRLRDVLPLPA